VYRIEPDLKEFLESGVAICVGTADPAGKPNVIMGWGPRVEAEGACFSVFLDAARAAVALANIEATDRIAVTLADPVSYRSVQLKGRGARAFPAGDADQAWVQRHREAFAVTTALVGDPPAAIRNLWMKEVLRVEFQVDAAFDQTPGPEAGRQL
jgi:hypothetical protein